MVLHYKLKNDLTVIHVPSDGTQTVTAMLLVPVGSRHEQSNNNGISHFLEHLMFKGTEKRPTTLELTKELDAVGAEYNASTGKDHTAYYIKVDATHLELALDLFSDMVFHSLFDPKEIDKERGVILEEIKMYEDNPVMYVDTLLETSIFGKQHPLGFDIGGRKQNIRRLPRSAFVRYKHFHYSPAAMHLVIAGKIDRKARRYIQQYFGSHPRGQRRSSFRRFASYQRRPQFHHKQQKSTQQTQLAIGFPGISYREPKRLATSAVLSTILGGNMSSRLFISIREKQGLCYVIQSEVTPYQDTGVFMIRAGVDSSRLRQAVLAITKELEMIKKTLVSKEELANAKDCIKGQLMLRLENTQALAGFYGRQSVLTGRLRSPQEYLAMVNQVRREDIRRLARNLLELQRLNIASIGPQSSIALIVRNLTF